VVYLAGNRLRARRLGCFDRLARKMAGIKASAQRFSAHSILRRDFEISSIK